MPDPNYVPRIVYGSGPTTIDFDMPPSDDTDEQRTPQLKQSTAIDGTRQTVKSHIEVTRTVRFQAVTQTQFDALNSMVDSWTSLGKTVDFYESNNLSTFVTYELDKGDLKPKRTVYSASKGCFLREVPITFRRKI